MNDEDTGCGVLEQSTITQDAVENIFFPLSVPGAKVISVSDGKRIVIIGLGAGGLYAAKYAMNTDPKSQVTVVERMPYDMFSPCGLPFALEGVVPSFEDLKHDVPGSLRRLEKLTNHEVTGVDPENKSVAITNLESGDEFTREYDSLVFATGSKPFIPDSVKPFVGKGVHFATTIENTQALKKAAESSGTKTAVCIGAGAIGLEIAYALKELGLDVHITKRTPPALPGNLDPDMGKMLEDHLVEKGFKLYWGQGFDSINGADHVESVTIGGNTIETDLVVLCIGVSGNTDLARASGVECSKKGIITDERMATNIPDVYAVGDCVQTFDFQTKEPTTMLLATSAYKQGQVAGVNAAGGEMRYDGALNTFVTQVGDFELSSTGFTTQRARDAGYDAMGVKAKFTDIPEYFPGHKNISVKIIMDKSNGKVLGGQAVGMSGCGTAWRVNMLALAIKHGLTVRDISNAELAYTPPVSDMYDVLAMTADFAVRRMK